MLCPFLKLQHLSDQLSDLDRQGVNLFLLTLPPATPRTDARQFARVALRKLLSRLTGACSVQLTETLQGPVFPPYQISLSYTLDKVLIGLSHKRSLGVDIIQIDYFSGIETLSKLYLPKAACVELLDAPADDRSHIFALAWARMEASCKALRLPLSEMDFYREFALSGCHLPDCEQIEGYKIAVAIRG
jgi:phosphopantetheinyl transferase